MSFYINNTNPNRPGPIGGNGLNGICEKVLIETTKVFDACVSQTTESGIILPVTNFNPPSPALPLTYISAQNTSLSTVTVSDITIDRIEQTPNYANVSLVKSVVLFVPQPSLSPVNITANALFTSSIGAYTADNTFTVTGCIQVIVKVVSVVDLLIPSYGYPVIPPCQAPEPASSCPGFQNVPLYPTATISRTIN